MAFLEVDNLHAYYGNIHALRGISLSVEKGEIVTLIGANGAGKSTTLRTVCSLMKPREGTVRFDGEDLAPYKAHEVILKGMSMVPEGRRIFARLTVSENLEMGAFTRTQNPEIAKDLERVFEL
ncbi:MAG TPA: ATP-binding cassette domain-containing protein, partial [Anaerolineales bacterium]